MLSVGSMNLRLFNAIVVSMLIAAILLVALALVTVNVLDRRVIEAAAARNRHAEFLRAASVVSRGVVHRDDLRNAGQMRPLLEDIQELRPGIQALEILELTPDGAKPVMQTGAGRLGQALSDSEVGEVRANKVLSYFEESGPDRSWVFTVPIVSNDLIVGALRGRFSVSKYDQLIEAQAQVAQEVAVGAVLITSLTMLLLVRIQLHRPIARLLTTMERVRSGQLNLEAPLTGPLEIRRLAENFNQMMAQLHAVMTDKERLVNEVRALNSTLEGRVTQAIRDLEQEKDKVVAARLAAERNSNLAALGEVSAIMAHEVGNPLNAMYGRLQLMKDLALPEDSRRHLEVVKTQVMRMTDVIQHILKSTRIEGEPLPVRINDVIDEVLTLVRQPEVHVVRRLATDLPPVALNPTSLHGVILNVVTNAVQAMKQKGTLMVTTSLADRAEVDGYVLVRASSRGQRMVRLVIEDSGVGIPDQVLGRMCEPFFTTRHDEGGTGLGLAVCRRVLAAAGGQLAVSSLPGKGTAFIIDCPVWTEEG